MITGLREVEIIRGNTPPIEASSTAIDFSPLNRNRGVCEPGVEIDVAKLSRFMVSTTVVPRSSC